MFDRFRYLFLLLNQQLLYFNIVATTVTIKFDKTHNLHKGFNVNSLVQTNIDKLANDKTYEVFI